MAPPAGVFLLDGVRVSDPRVSVFDRGFLYGEAVFETVRVYGTTPWRLEEHLARMRTAATAIGISMPPTARWIDDACSAIAASDWEGDSSLRLTLSRGAAAPGFAGGADAIPLRLTLLAPVSVEPDVYRAGSRAAVIAIDRSAPREGVLSIGALKTANYLLHLRAHREAQRVGAQTALLVRADRVLLEAATANVFLVEGGRVRTPALADGPLDGITRRDVLRIAARLGYATQECTLREADLWTADEAFATSSLREIVPLVAVDAHDVGDARPGPITRALHRAYRSEATPGIAAMPWE